MAQNQKNVTKADMISEIASRTGLNKADVKTVIETFIALVKEAIARRVFHPVARLRNLLPQEESLQESAQHQ